jgi:hypothetical protein
MGFNSLTSYLTEGNVLIKVHFLILWLAPPNIDWAHWLTFARSPLAMIKPVYDLAVVVAGEATDWGDIGAHKVAGSHLISS